MKRRSFPLPVRALPPLGLMALLAACALPTRHSAPVAPELPAQWQGRAAAPEGLAPAPWWQTLADPALQALQSEALQANRDIAQSLLRWRRAQAEAELQAQGQSLWPSLGLNASASRPLQTGGATRVVQVGGVSVPVSQSVGVSKSFSLSASVGYEVDLWSRLSAMAQGARVDADAAATDVQTARWLVSTQVAELYWAVALIDTKLPLLQARLANAQEALRLSQTRLDNGRLKPVEVDQASLLVYDIQAQLAAQEADRRNQARALALLLDRSPTSYELPQARLPLAALPDWRVGPPAQVLDQRPDVRKAKLAVDAALQRLNVAEAARYPSLNLSGGVSTGSPQWRELLAQTVGSLGLGLTVPLVNWRRLVLERDQAHSQLDEAALTWRDSVHRALADVDQQFTQANRLQREEQAGQAHLANARQVQAQSHLRYEVGMIGKLEWLGARNGLLDAELSQVDRQLAAWRNALAIFKALGGPV